MLGPLPCSGIAQDTAVCVDCSGLLSVLVHAKLFSSFFRDVAAVWKVLHRCLSDQLIALDWLHRLAIYFLTAQGHCAQLVLLLHGLHISVCLLKRAFQAFISNNNEESAHVPIILIEQINFRVENSRLLTLSQRAG